jgi:glutamyl-Q tRNA(Asp) synthetase
LPLVVNDQGQKLSKQNQARAIDLDTPYENLCRALAFLQQARPKERMSISGLLEWATARWQPQSIPPSHGGLIG